MTTGKDAARQIFQTERIPEITHEYSEVFAEYEVPDWLSGSLRRNVENSLYNARSRAMSELFASLVGYGISRNDLASWSRANLGDDHEAFMSRVRAIDAKFKSTFLHAWERG